VIEAEVHQQLRAFLREQGEPHWHHHLTMARLVARALRLGRSALIQTGTYSGYQSRHRLSYLMPALLWPQPAILAVPQSMHPQLLLVDIPRIQDWMTVPKPVQTGDRFPDPHFAGLLITTPEAWLADRLNPQGRFPDGVPVIVDGADDIEAIARRHLTLRLEPAAWDELMLACPDQVNAIRDSRVRLIHNAFQHPPNPYNCYLLDAAEQAILHQLYQQLQPGSEVRSKSPHEPHEPGRAIAPLPQLWLRFFQQMQTENQLVWATVSRSNGQFSLHSSPAELASTLDPIWRQQPVVLIGSALDLETDAPIYRQRIGLQEMTCLKFCPDRHHELIQLYLPDGLPMPNTAQFQPALLSEIRALLSVNTAQEGLTVVLVGDLPLKAQVASALASEYGSRVQVENPHVNGYGVLVAGWGFWRQHQARLPVPRLLVIATLPIPSLEEPLVAGRVSYYKRRRQDWFRLFLLPEALTELQRAVAPIRETQGVVALLDNRVNHRSYGKQVLAALHPLARINYVDASLFSHLDCAPVDPNGDPR
jgi:ATP-dependent DNA helicase DinG